MRRADWAPALNAYLIESQERYLRNGFEWGRFDCVHWGGNWHQIATGVDPLTDIRGLYRTREEAFALLEQRYGTFEAALAAKLGEPVHPSKAARGDLAYCRSIQACGIYFTSAARKVALFLGEGGFVLHRARETDLAFRVG
jgi:hypothetical protein